VTIDPTSQPRAATAYLECPRCRLNIEVRSGWLAMTHCPRCVARSRMIVELVSAGVAADRHQDVERELRA
jgi:hypothetical protein